MLSPTTTAFGSVLDTPQRSGAVLRAAASVAGLELAEVSDNDLVAAVLAAHCWALITGNTSLRGKFTPAIAAGLVPALARAAGHGAELDEDYAVSAVKPLDRNLWKSIKPVTDWAYDVAAPAALIRASYDLAGTPYSGFSNVAQNLYVLGSENVSDTRLPQARGSHSHRTRPA